MLIGFLVAILLAIYFGLLMELAYLMEEFKEGKKEEDDSKCIE